MTTYYTDKWVHYYMRIALEVANGSKDGSTKVGAVLARPDKSIASTGFNGFPPAIHDDMEILNASDPALKALKLQRIVHAEVNCLDFCRDFDLRDYAIFVTCHPCDKCALKLVNKNIGQVYYLRNEDFETRWKEQVQIAKSLFNLAGVTCTPVRLEDL